MRETKKLIHYCFLISIFYLNTLLYPLSSQGFKFFELYAEEVNVSLEHSPLNLLANNLGLLGLKAQSGELKGEHLDHVQRSVDKALVHYKGKDKKLHDQINQKINAPLAKLKLLHRVMDRCFNGQKLNLGDILVSGIINSNCDYNDLTDPLEKLDALSKDIDEVLNLLIDESGPYQGNKSELLAQLKGELYREQKKHAVLTYGAISSRYFGKSRNLNQIVINAGGKIRPNQDKELLKELDKLPDYDWYEREKILTKDTKAANAQLKELHTLNKEVDKVNKGIEKFYQGYSKSKQNNSYDRNCEEISYGAFLNAHSCNPRGRYREVLATRDKLKGTPYFIQNANVNGSESFNNSLNKMILGMLKDYQRKNKTDLKVKVVKQKYFARVKGVGSLLKNKENRVEFNEFRLADIKKDERNMFVLKNPSKKITSLRDFLDSSLKVQGTKKPTLPSPEVMAYLKKISGKDWQAVKAPLKDRTVAAHVTKEILNQKTPIEDVDIDFSKESYDDEFSNDLDKLYAPLIDLEYKKHNKIRLHLKVSSPEYEEFKKQRLGEIKKEVYSHLQSQVAAAVAMGENNSVDVNQIKNLTFKKVKEVSSPSGKQANAFLNELQQGTNSKQQDQVKRTLKNKILQGKQREEFSKDREDNLFYQGSDTPLEEDALKESLQNMMGLIRKHMRGIESDYANMSDEDFVIESLINNPRLVANMIAKNPKYARLMCELSVIANNTKLKRKAQGEENDRSVLKAGLFLALAVAATALSFGLGGAALIGLLIYSTGGLLISIPTAGYFGSRYFSLKGESEDAYASMLINLNVDDESSRSETRKLYEKAKEKMEKGVWAGVYTVTDLFIFNRVIRTTKQMSDLYKLANGGSKALDLAIKEGRKAKNLKELDEYAKIVDLAQKANRGGASGGEISKLLTKANIGGRAQLDIFADALKGKDLLKAANKLQLSPDKTAKLILHSSSSVTDKFKFYKQLSAANKLKDPLSDKELLTLIKLQHSINTGNPIVHLDKLTRNMTQFLTDEQRAALVMAKTREYERTSGTAFRSKDALNLVGEATIVAHNTPATNIIGKNRVLLQADVPAPVREWAMRLGIAGNQEEIHLKISQAKKNIETLNLALTKVSPDSKRAQQFRETLEFQQSNLKRFEGQLANYKNINLKAPAQMNKDYLARLDKTYISPKFKVTDLAGQNKLSAYMDHAANHLRVNGVKFERSKDGKNIIILRDPSSKHELVKMANQLPEGTQMVVNQEKLLKHQVNGLHIINPGKVDDQLIISHRALKDLRADGRVVHEFEHVMLSVSEKAGDLKDPFAGGKIFADEGRSISALTSGMNAKSQRLQEVRTYRAGLSKDLDDLASVDKRLKELSDGAEKSELLKRQRELKEHIAAGIDSGHSVMKQTEEVSKTMLEGLKSGRAALEKVQKGDQYYARIKLDGVNFDVHLGSHASKVKSEVLNKATERLQTIYRHTGEEIADFSYLKRNLDVINKRPGFASNILSHHTGGNIADDLGQLIGKIERGIQDGELPTLAIIERASEILKTSKAKELQNYQNLKGRIAYYKSLGDFDKLSFHDALKGTNVALKLLQKNDPMYLEVTKLKSLLESSKSARGLKNAQENFNELKKVSALLDDYSKLTSQASEKNVKEVIALQNQINEIKLATPWAMEKEFAFLKNDTAIGNLLNSGMNSKYLQELEKVSILKKNLFSNGRVISVSISKGGSSPYSKLIGIRQGDHYILLRRDGVKLSELRIPVNEIDKARKAGAEATRQSDIFIELDKVQGESLEIFKSKFGR